MPEPPPLPQPETTWQILRRLGATLWAAGFTLTVPALGMVILWRFGEPVVEFWRGLGPGGPFLYAAAFGALNGASLLPTWVQALLAGFLFGAERGLPVAMGAIMLGAIIGYGLARVLSGDRARRLVNEHPKWKAVEVALLESGFWRELWVVALVRLPSTPFALTNLVMAAVRARLPAFLLGTLVGTLPRTLLWVTVGRSLHAFNQKAVSEAPVPWWSIPLLLVGLVLALAAIGLIARRALAHATRT
jgi:uncharacterized membrane protein YdjX (TVP38/TMEM64 family)